MEYHGWRYCSAFIGDTGSLNYCVLGDHVCGSTSGRVLGCPDPETTLGVRMYSLRKP